MCGANTATTGSMTSQFSLFPANPDDALIARGDLIRLARKLLLA
jgi:hypothetical protein